MSKGPTSRQGRQKDGFRRQRRWRTVGVFPAWILAMAVGLWLVGGGAAWAGCPLSIRAPVLDIRVDNPPVVYDFSQERSALATIASEYGTPDFGSDRVPYGLTVNQYDAPRIDLETDTVKAPGGSCVYLKSVHILLGLKRLEILIDRAYPAGTCEHDAILAHEEQHVAVAREAMSRYQAQIGSALGAASLPVVVFVGANNASVDPLASFLVPLRRAIDPVAAAIQRRIDEGNARLDAPASYAETFQRCDNWGAAE